MLNKYLLMLLSVILPTGIRLFAATGHTLDNSSVKQDSALKGINAWVYTRILFPQDFDWSFKRISRDTWC